MLSRVVVFLLLLVCHAAQADLVRIDFAGPVTSGAGSPPYRPMGSVLEGYVVYDSDAPGIAGIPARFSDAVLEFELGGLRSGRGDVFMVAGGGYISFTSGGLQVVFYGDPGTFGSALPAEFPSGLTDAAWEINPPAEPGFSGGRVTAYSSTASASSPVLSQGPRVLLVASDGSDSPACGQPDRKCRSLSQAIRNAADGDTVLVEVGTYGDLNGNGILGEPGEEPGFAACSCLVLIDKRISVLSERGTAATIIDASSTGLAGIGISHAGVAFGFESQGFTVLIGRGGTGVTVGPLRTATIWGNRFVGVHGLAAGAAESDRARAGIIATDADVYANEVSGAVTGIAVARGRVAGNIVTRNVTGVDVNGVFVEANVIADNHSGVVLSGAIPAAVTANDIARNRDHGVFLRAGSSPAAVIQDNNLAGNGYAEPAARCGLRNDTGGFVWAADNYWGSAGNADRVCNGLGSVTAIDPVRFEPDGRD